MIDLARSIVDYETALRTADVVGDVYFEPWYLAAHEANGDGRPVFWTFREGNDVLLIAGMETPVPAGSASDVQTPNGYGGPLASAGASTEFLARAWDAWRHDATRGGVVAAFFRLHPLIDSARWLPADARIIADRATVAVPVQAGGTAVAAAAEWRHRNRLTKAAKSGGRIEWCSDWRFFREVYAEAMASKNAVDSLRFRDGYWSTLESRPEVELCVAYEHDRPVAGHVYLWGPAHGHYHLGARRADAPDWATALLMQAGFERAHERGLVDVHLGGGATTKADDGLLRFKRTFGGREATYRVALVVADQVRFARLADQWTALNGIRPSWLLGYRQPPVR